MPVSYMDRHADWPVVVWLVGGGRRSIVERLNARFPDYAVRHRPHYYDTTFDYLTGIGLPNL